MGGEGKSHRISLSPPLLNIGGTLPMEKTWTGKVTLSNPSNIIAEVEFCQELMTVSNANASASVIKPEDFGGSLAIEDVEGENGDMVGVDVVGDDKNSAIDPSYFSAPDSDTGIVRLNKIQVELDPPVSSSCPTGRQK